MIKTWLITGSARGLGRSIAETALNAGDNVVATARDISKFADLQAKHGSKLRPFILDVSEAAAAQKAVAFALERFGGLDVLVNNAGYGHTVPFEQTTVESFRAQIDTNFYGVVNLTRAALPIMRQQRSGTIINISSVGGRAGTPGLSAYQAAKWAVGGFTEVLAQELAPFGVKIISVEPGGIRTDWAAIATSVKQNMMPDYESSVGAVLTMLQAMAGNEIGDPEKIAKVILDLADRDALPPHLLLGSDAQYIFNTADAARQQAAAEWAVVTTSTDFEGTELSFLGDNYA
jgi:NAD(P)-dependent dehydrogenase (short-subunit alcohol dehydrogenase family)